MLTLSKPLSANQARTYHGEEFSNARVNYYTTDPVIQGSWHGQLAEQWGLVGHVDDERFQRLAEGQHPMTGDALVRHQTACRYTNAAGKTVIAMDHRAGWDATFSAPKSVSLTALVGGDERVREAHREAVAAALLELEPYVQARLGGHLTPEPTGKWVAATFEHDSARPVDGYAAPQLHTHVVVFNLTRTQVGDVRPVQPQELYRSQQFATAVYRSALAARLHDLGYDLVRGASGQPEIRGYSDAYLEASSPRRRQIAAHLEAHDKHGAASAQVAAHHTRQPKIDRSRAAMQRQHQDLALAFGDQPAHVVEAAHERVSRLEPHVPRVSARMAVAYAESRGFEREAVVGERQLLRDALKLSMGEVSLSDLRRELARRVEAGEFIARPAPPGVPGRAFTTREMLDLERDTIAIMSAGQGQYPELGQTTWRDLQRAHAHLNADQLSAIGQILVTRDRVVALEGIAGAGKTTALTAIRTEAERAGYQVEGFAPTSRAAQLLAAAGMRSSTLQEHLVTRHDGTHEEKRLYVLDESSLASTRQMHAFLTRLQRVRFGREPKPRAGPHQRRSRRRDISRMTHTHPRILILTALVEEHRALVEMMTGSQTVSQIDYFVELTIGPADVDLLCLSNTGNVNAAVQSAFHIARYLPRFVILCGIAGGIRSASKLALGDIIVADQVVLYEASKIRHRPYWFGHDIERRFLSFPAGATLLRAAKHLRVDQWPVTVVKGLQRERAGRSAPRVTVGPIASGEKVVADASFLDPLIRSYPLLKGIEMEGGGVMCAAHSAGYSCESILIKSVCDWADHYKNDDWHEVAAYAAAAFVKHLVDYVAASLDTTAEHGGSSHPRDDGNPTTAGLFIEFLNPESQRIYGLDATLASARADQARVVINTALFLCRRGVVFPIGTFLETPYLTELLPDLQPLIDRGCIRFSMREETIDKFLAKRRIWYRDQQATYPALFDDPNARVREAFRKSSMISKESQIGKRIAQLFSVGPRNLVEWEPVVAQFSSAQITLISSIPGQLMAENQAVTWPAFEERLIAYSIEPSFELRRLLQLTYCNIYVSEYGLEYLRNVEFAPFELLPSSEMRRYDFSMLKRVLTIGGLWDRVASSDAVTMIRLYEMSAYQDFINVYEEQCRLPMSDTDIDALVRELRHISDGVSAGKTSQTRAGSVKERLVKTMRELRVQLTRDPTLRTT